MSVLWAHVSLGFQDNNVNLLKSSYTSWSSDKELPELKSSLQTIQKTAHDVIEQLDSTILKNTNNLDISLTVADEPMKISSIGDTHHHRR